MAHSGERVQKVPDSTANSPDTCGSKTNPERNKQGYRNTVDVLVFSIAEYLRVVLYFDRPARYSAILHTKTLQHLIRYLLSNVFALYVQQVNSDRFVRDKRGANVST